MSKLEQFIIDHNEEFDDQEPDPGHFSRFKEKLNKPTSRVIVPPVRNMFLRIAAVIVVLITVTVFVFDWVARELREGFSTRTANTELPAEVREVVQYYDLKVVESMGKLNALAANPVEAGILKKDAEREISNLDANSGELKHSLAENPDNERILAAFILNQQMKVGVIDNMIDKLMKIKQ
jgi:hypothetical protein